jgi:hypothetical protein
MTKEINLGHLIFGGNVWKLLGGPISSEIDPLSAMYIKQGKSLCANNLVCSLIPSRAI